MFKDFVEASVEGSFVTERLAKGDVHVRWVGENSSLSEIELYRSTNFRWLAKKIDYQTPMFNDSVVYREVLHVHSKLVHY